MSVTAWLSRMLFLSYSDSSNVAHVPRSPCHCCWHLTTGALPCHVPKPELLCWQGARPRHCWSIPVPISLLSQHTEDNSNAVVAAGLLQSPTATGLAATAFPSSQNKCQMLSAALHNWSLCIQGPEVRQVQSGHTKQTPLWFTNPCN